MPGNLPCDTVRSNDHLDHGIPFQIMPISKAMENGVHRSRIVTFSSAIRPGRQTYPRGTIID